MSKSKLKYKLFRTLLSNADRDFYLSEFGKKFNSGSSHLITIQVKTEKNIYDSEVIDIVPTQLKYFIRKKLEQIKQLIEEYE